MKPGAEKIPIGISSCLLGEPVRYDGGHKLDEHIVTTLGEHFELIPFCPEMNIGLGVPREPVHLIDVNGSTRCIGTKTNSLDITDKLINCAHQQRDMLTNIFGYIFKARSPSCGLYTVPVIINNVAEHKGSGLYAKTVMEDFPGLPVEEEGHLADSAACKDFIQRVLNYKHSVQNNS